MPRKQRDYKAEYQRRLARAQSLGYDKSVARGHPRKGTFGIKAAKVLKAKPGDSLINRPKFKGGKFRDKLRAAGLSNFVADARREVIKERVDPKIGGKRLDRIVTSQQEFLTVVMNAGFTSNEAYSLWFSPK